jgi:hypothetical protein
MKTFISIIVAGAVLALAVPAAFAAHASYPAESTVGERLGEIGAWAADASRPADPTIGEKLGEIGAWAVPSKKQPLRLTHTGKVQHVDVRIRKQSARIKALIAKNKALAARNNALAAENVAQVGTIGNLNSTIWKLTHPSTETSALLPSDRDQDCVDSLLCTPEQNCRIWGLECSVASTTPAIDASNETSPTEAVAASQR